MCSRSTPRRVTPSRVLRTPRRRRSRPQKDTVAPFLQQDGLADLESRLYYSPYISVMTRRKAAASFLLNELILSPSRALLTARIWSTASSA